MTTATAQNAIYFVDSTLPDLATLLAGLPAGAEVHLIEPGADGVQLLCWAQKPLKLWPCPM